MNNEEIIEIINKEVRAETERYNDYYLTKIQEKSQELSDGFEYLKKNIARMEQIESLIQSHAQGVQNVYNEMTKIKKLFDTDNVKNMIALIDSCNKDFESFKNAIFDLNSYLDD